MRYPVGLAPAVCSQLCFGARSNAKPVTSFADRAPSLPAFFHHARIRGLKSSAISEILIERTFKIVGIMPEISSIAGQLSKS
ncbi:MULTISPECIES: hypothetical protein [unclassified Mesorhizobium]|uniref:hypothetical protein n=1 Tax=unclassified Mesorhizobium TaxID=325217 RepID=UPI0011294C8E|nr:MULTISPECIES: hypothetical protein [unclassified Mesorhizobium]TPI47210.1 hypothetical protein FJW11_27400 [Mesorhizobium sp. B3-1-1]TPJ62541.1 hypothetical protein FJ462_25225 [Mesorhizobium sp. B2-6-7]TPJ78917.1 hypothetical protein FJ422_26175 [Mesorhizobium sp. B2-6-3]TPJ93959.1 hypothetical protein FJ491_27115 [Mesorhizobium sp. B2-5-10]TPK04691.1 hypothetical protein FJ490_30010 [Mesorhizobium sp. B2-5-11]